MNQFTGSKPFRKTGGRAAGHGLLGGTRIAKADGQEYVVL
jgi:hypothetical protein